MTDPIPDPALEADDPEAEGTEPDVPTDPYPLHPDDPQTVEDY